MTARADGFTLLEMTVALVVLGLVVLGAAQGVRFGIAGWTVQSRHIAATAELDGVDRVLRGLFHGIDVAAIEQVQGTADQFAFVGRLPDALPGVLRVADMSLALTGDHRLVLRWRPHRHAVPLAAPPLSTETELIGGVKSVTFSYQTGSASGWQTSISSAIPTLIKVHIVGVKGDPRQWPDIVAAPVVSPP